ncbi:hypothetical protein Vafri_4712 [Volvox africanus]|uniref:DNA polymerase delta subunit 3 n=1 Tax=Volvox africanus TaxID=51714 RepID=A0A8J4AYT4_9CHLO|nr:hypothetical protein Vafri_4712 [Volvox africanus]
MPIDDSAEILQELISLVHDELKVLSYKWVARHYSISANTAKRVLFQLAEHQRDKVRTVYLVSGWTKQEPPSHVHRLVEAEQLQVLRESLGDITGMHVYSVAPNQATNPDSLWQVTYQQSQQLLKEIMSGQPSASAEVFRNNSCSAVRFTAPQQQARQPTAAAPAPHPAKGAGPGQRTAQPQQQPQQSERRAKQAETDTAVGNVTTVAPTVAAAAPASSPPKTEEASPHKASGPSPHKAAVGKAAAATLAKPNTLANMWGKASTKPKAAAAAAAPAVMAEASAEAAPTAVPVPAPIAGDEDEEDTPVHVVAGRGRGRKRRGAQIEESEDEGGEEPVVEAAMAAAPTEVEDLLRHRGKGRDSKGAKAKGTSKGDKEEKGKAAGTKRSKAAAAVPTASPAPVLEAVESNGGDDTNMDEAVMGALETAAAVAPQQQPALLKPAGAAGGGARGRKVTRTYINDQGEEVTEEVWEDGPVPLQPQQQPQQPAVPPATAAAKGKPAAKPPAAGNKTAKGKAPAAGQKSMTAFFNKK